MTIREYIDLQHVQLDAVRFLPQNSTTVNISISNKWDRTDFTFDLHPPSSQAAVTPSTYRASHGEKLSVKIEMEPTIDRTRCGAVL